MRLWLLFLSVILGAATHAQSLDSLITFSPDSLLNPYQQKLDSVQRTFYQQSDSLKNTFKQKLSVLDSSRMLFQTKADSLKGLNLSTEKYTHKLDSIKQQQEKVVASLNQKMESLKSKTIRRVKELNLPPELQEKASTVTKNIEGFKLPVKDLNVPSLDLPDNPLKSLDGLNSSFKSPLGSIGEIDGLKNVSESLGDVSKITDQIGGYQKDLQSIANGDLSEVKQLPKTLEEKAIEYSGLDKIQEQTKGLTPLMDAAKDPEAMKAEAAKKVQEIAIDHFAGKEKELKESMEKLSKLKKKYSSLNSLSEIPKRRPNEMRGKPLIERLLPGIAIQLQKKGGDLLSDLNPYVGYRFTGRLTGGLGWNQRVAYNFNTGIFNKQEKVYGPRIFTEFKLNQVFTPRIEFEVMNTYVPFAPKPGTIDTQRREWVLGASIGIKREYRFLKNIKGTAMLMLRLYNPDYKSPYKDVVNMRFGFEFPMKKKK